MSAFTHPLQRIISGKDHTLALFNLSFLEWIITDALEDHEGTVSVGGRTVTSLRFADDIDGLPREEEPSKLVERLPKASTVYGMEILEDQVDDKQHQWHQHRDQSK